MSGTECVAASEAETRTIAAALARECRRGDCILLRGDLGAGKTTFARGFIHALAAAAEEVVSPTFTLVQTYPTERGMLWHFDLYRLKSEGELVEIGLDEALEDGITLIEWPEIAQSALPETALDVTISAGDNEHARRLAFSGKGWDARLKKAFA